MSKKKEPTGTKVKTESNKITTQPAAITPPVVEPTKPAEAAKPAPTPAPAPAPKAAEQPAAPAPASAPKAAEKPAAPAPAPTPAPKAAEKPAAPAPAPTPAPKAAEKPATPAKAEKPAAPAKAAKSAEHPKSVVTTVVAKYDVGHGNRLYIRGEGAGLSWDSGILMDNDVGSDVWVWTTTQIAEDMVAFKFLINDEIWATGDNQSAPAGKTTTLSPSF